MEWNWFHSSSSYTMYRLYALNHKIRMHRHKIYSMSDHGMELEFPFRSMEWNGMELDAERMEHVVPWNGTGMELSWHGMEWNGTGQPMEWNGMELIWMEWNWNFPFHGTAHPCRKGLFERHVALHT